MIEVGQLLWHSGLLTRGGEYEEGVVCMGQGPVELGVGTYRLENMYVCTNQLIAVCTVNWCALSCFCRPVLDTVPLFCRFHENK